MSRKVSINGIVLDTSRVPVIKGGNFEKIRQNTAAPPPPPPPPPPDPTVTGSGDVIIRVKFGLPPVSASSSFHKLKYGKPAMVNIEEDDAPSDFPDLINYIQGGTVSLDGQTYPGKACTDGCGNPIKWTAAVGVNVRSNYDNNLVLEDNAAGRGELDVSLLASFPPRGCLPMPHGYYHQDQGTIHNPPSQPDWYVGSNFTKSLNVSECNKYIWDKTNGFLPRCFIIPQDSQGYNIPLKAQGFLAQSSEGVVDGEPEFPHPPDIYVNSNSFVNDVIALNGAYGAFRRFFVLDWNNTSQTDALKSQMSYVLDNGTVDNPQFRRVGTHAFANVQWLSIKAFLDWLEVYANDRAWITTLQEFMEYLETRRLLIKSETLIGDTLEIRLNYNNIPNENLYRDISLKIAATENIQSVTVTNAQGYSYNMNTGLINVFNKRRTVAYPYSQILAGGGTLVTGLLPLRPQDIWLDNSERVVHDALVDGNLTANYLPAFDKANLIYPNYDIVINLERYRTTISNVAISFGSGAGGTTDTRIILIRADTGAEVDIGSWTQNGFNQTDNFPHTGTFRVAKLILRPLTNLSYGAEIRITGTYQPVLNNPFVKRKPALAELMGANDHPWDLSQNVPSHAIYPQKMAIYKSLNMYAGSLRMYLDAYANKTLSGNWSLGTEIRGFTNDLTFADLKATFPRLRKRGVWQNMSLAVQPSWDVDFADRYIQGTVVDYQNNITWGFLRISVTVVGGSGRYKDWHVYSGATKLGNANLDVILSNTLVSTVVGFNVEGNKPYVGGQLLQFRKWQTSGYDVILPADGELQKTNYLQWDVPGETAFVLASRFGKNTNVPDYPVNNATGENPMTKGSDLWELFEILNEPDAFWTDKYSYTNGHDLFYLWSMCYDGHMGQFPNRGIKQADSSAKLLASGLANGSVDELQGAFWQAEKIRGKNPDGTTNLPFDGISLHIYSGGQYSTSAGGLPPEQGMWQRIKDAILFIRERGTQLIFNIGEYGWDSNQGSPLCARTFGSYTDGRQVAAMWHVRAMMIGAIEGVDMMDVFRLYQDSNADDNNAGQFATMALLRYVNDTTFVRTVVGDYFKQWSEFGDYTVDSAVPTGIPNVYCYKLINGTNTVMALWSEEATAIVSNLTSFTERTGTFALPVPSNANLIIRTFVENGSGVMASQNAVASGTTYNISYSSKLKFIQVFPATPTRVIVGRQAVDTFTLDSPSAIATAAVGLPTTYDSDPITTTYPLILNFHGIGEAASPPNIPLLENVGLPGLIRDGYNVEAISPLTGLLTKFITVSPQHAWFSFGQPFAPLPYLLDSIIAKYRVDITRIYVTGLSAGAQGVISAVTNDPAFAQRIAAIMPISFTGWNAPSEQSNTPLIGSSYHVPMWSVVGTAEQYYSRAVQLRDLYNSTSPNPLGTLDEIPGGQHNDALWRLVFSDAWATHANNSKGESLWRWALRNHR
jgi:hypothetical protein